MRFWRRNPTATGFSLIETLVALAIVGIMTAAIAEVFGVGLLGHQASDTVATALSLAESRIAEAGVIAPLAPRETEGMFADRFHWRLTVARYEDPQKNEGRGAAEPANGLQLYRVGVVVDWRDGLRRRQVALDTLRSGPPPP